LSQQEIPKFTVLAYSQIDRSPPAGFLPEDLKCGRGQTWVSSR